MLSMSLQFSQNLEQRLTLVQKLGLESEYFESFLVRTEKLLKQKKYQKGLTLIVPNDTKYASVLDWLLAMLAPSWKAHIHAFYKYGPPRLGHAVDFQTIDLMDQLMEAAVVDLAHSYRMLREESWLTKHKPEPGVFLQRTTMNAVREFISPAFPKAPVHPGQVSADGSYFDARVRVA